MKIKIKSESFIRVRSTRRGRTWFKRRRINWSCLHRRRSLVGRRKKWKESYVPFQFCTEDIRLLFRFFHFSHFLLWIDSKWVKEKVFFMTSFSPFSFVLFSFVLFYFFILFFIFFCFVLFFILFFILFILFYFIFILFYFLFSLFSFLFSLFSFLFSFSSFLFSLITTLTTDKSFFFHWRVIFWHKNGFKCFSHRLWILGTTLHKWSCFNFLCKFDSIIRCFT